eukprot:3369878-Prymnesium_polylepis.1
MPEPAGHTIERSNCLSHPAQSMPGYLHRTRGPPRTDTEARTVRAGLLARRGVRPLAESLDSGVVDWSRSAGTGESINESDPETSPPPSRRAARARS